MDKQEIIGFYDHYTDTYEYSILNGKKVVDRQANDIARFFSSEHLCPFCHASLVTTFMAFRNGAVGRDIFFDEDVMECPHCGWWTLRTRFSEEDDVFDMVKLKGIYSTTKYYGITQRFQVDDKDLPIHVLNTELAKRPELLYSITPRKLEELAQDILTGVFDCEVQHVGQRGDGGTDLIVLDTDSPILVQVKQRQNRDHVELVKGVREFVGTMFIEGTRKGIYISTAKQYSRGSKQTAQKLLDSRKLDYFELVDYDRLCQLITKRTAEKPWKALVQRAYSDSHAQIYDTPERIQQHQNELKQFEKMYFTLK